MSLVVLETLLLAGVASLMGLITYTLMNHNLHSPYLNMNFIIRLPQA